MFVSVQGPSTSDCPLIVLEDVQRYLGLFEGVPGDSRRFGEVCGCPLIFSVEFSH
jgi:hypothetical protein